MTAMGNTQVSTASPPPTLLFNTKSRCHITEGDMATKWQTTTLVIVCHHQTDTTWWWCNVTTPQHDNSMMTPPLYDHTTTTPAYNHHHTTTTPMTTWCDEDMMQMSDNSPPTLPMNSHNSTTHKWQTWRALYTPPPIPTGLLLDSQTGLGLGQISCWLITIQILSPSPSGVLVNSYWNDPKSQGIADS